MITLAVRKMPQNIEAEMSVLGVTFLSNTALEKVCEEISEDMFFKEETR